MSWQVEAGQSVLPQEPSDRPGNVGQNSTNREPKITRNSHQEHIRGPRAVGAVALGGFALLFLSVACRDGRAEGSKTPTETFGSVTTERTKAPEPTSTPVELPYACDVTYEKLNTLRQIDGKNWTDVVNDALAGKYKFKEVSEIIQYPGGNRAKYLDTYPDTHGGSGRYLVREDLQTGETLEIRDPETVGEVMFESLFPDDPNNPAYYPFQRVKPEDSELILALALARDGFAVSQFEGQRVRLAPRQVKISVDLWRMSIDSYSGQAGVQGLRVTANTTESPPDMDKLSDFPITTTNIEGGGKVAFCDIK